MRTAAAPDSGPVAFPRRIRAAAATVALLAAGGGLVVLLPGAAVETKNTVNAWAYPIASLGGGIVLVAAALAHGGRRRLALLMIGAGILAWGMGEAVSECYWALGREVPYPSWIDVLFLLGYPLLGAGVALLPRSRLGGFERARSALDAAVAVIATALAAWLLYLDRAISLDPRASVLENWTNALYPIGDAVLLLAVLGLALRQTERRRGGERLALGAAMGLHAIADMVFFALTSAGTYYDGMWLDGVWLLGYAALAAGAWLSLRPERSSARRMAPRARLFIAYVPVLVLLAVVLATESAGRRYLTLTWVALAVLIVGRQWVANRETREVVEAGRDAVLASVSHDLRTPLAAVRGYSQLLTNEWERFQDGERREMVQAIDDQAAHITRIVTDIIEVTRGRAPAATLDRRPCPAGRLLHEAVASLPLEARPQVTVEAGRGTIADADPERIHQVLVNLLTNALRYGKPPVLARAERVGSAVSFEIHDAGPGIPRRFEHSIWERFDRGAHRHEPTSGGLGLGLPIARALVEAHGGSIRQRPSEVLGGACFEFTVPAAPADAPDAPRTKPAPEVPIPAQAG